MRESKIGTCLGKKSAASREMVRARHSLPVPPKVTSLFAVNLLLIFHLFVWGNYWNSMSYTHEPCSLFSATDFPMLNQNPREIRGEVNAYQDMKSVARAGERFANTERSEVSITFTVFVHRQLGSACCRMMEGGRERTANAVYTLLLGSSRDERT